VREGQLVKAGDLLFRIDPEPYSLQIAETDAAIASAQANVTALSNASELSGADIAAAREDIAFAQATLDREEALWRRGFTTKADYEAAQHAVAQGRERLRLAEADQREARLGLRTGRRCPASTRRSPPPRRAAPKPSSHCAEPQFVHRSPAAWRSPTGSSSASRRSPACRC
jgi:membrane fusion protein (multidrug efflux system)